MGQTEDLIFLDYLKIIMGDNLKPEKEDLAVMIIGVASDGLRQLFKNCGMDLDERIMSGEISKRVVAYEVGNMVANYFGTQNSPFGEFTNLSQTAGGYSFNISGTGGSLYLKKESMKRLGLPTIMVSEINLFGGK